MCACIFEKKINNLGFNIGPGPNLAKISQLATVAPRKKEGNLKMEKEANKKDIKN